VVARDYGLGWFLTRSGQLGPPLTRDWSQAAPTD
jgi:hypothetical protein